MCGVKSVNLYGEYDALIGVLENYEKIEVQILNSETGETWNFIFRDTFFGKNVPFLKKSARFLLKPRISDQFWPKTLGKHSTSVSEARGLWNPWKTEICAPKHQWKKPCLRDLHDMSGVANSKSMLIICYPCPPQNVHDEIHVPTGSARMCGFWT